MTDRIRHPSRAAKEMGIAVDVVGLLVGLLNGLGLAAVPYALVLVAIWIVIAALFEEFVEASTRP